MNVLKNISKGINSVIAATSNGSIVHNGKNIIGNISQREISIAREDYGYNVTKQLEFRGKYNLFRVNEIITFKGISYKIVHVNEYDSHTRILANEDNGHE